MRLSLSAPLLASGLMLCFTSSHGDWTSPHPLQQEKAAPVPLIPFPSQVDWKTGTCPKKAPVSVKKNASLSKTLGKEGYELRIRPNGILITAADDAGVFYARRTLDQLGARGDYPCCDIKDSPAFAIRCFMHDAGRHFRTVETLKADIDEMARLKINAFHWHLTDYPAWRIQCKKYPVLNDPSKRIQGRDVNGTYSYDQIRDLFRYARERHVQIIPEIDMPGHSTYFKNCFGFPMHDPRGINILEELLEEFCREIPAEMSPYLHIGADEIRIPNGKQFADRMAAKVKSLGRQPIQWAGNNDLPVSGDSYAQLWNDENSVGLPDPARRIPTSTPRQDTSIPLTPAFWCAGISSASPAERPGETTIPWASFSVYGRIPGWRTKKTFLFRVPSGLPCSPWRNAVGKEFQRMVPVLPAVCRKRTRRLIRPSLCLKNAWKPWPEAGLSLTGGILSWNGRYSAPFRRTGRKK